MADRSVKGRIVYAGTDTGIKGLEVHAFDVDPIVSDDHLGKDTTDGEGKFKITYSESDYRVWFTSNNPDIRVRIYGPVSRLLFETPVKENVAEEPFDLQTIEIHKNHIGEESDANSWLVTNATLNRLKGDTVPVTQGNQLDWLVDGLTLFPAITDTLLTAQQSISFMNLNFWVAGSKESLAKNDLLITKFESGFISTNPPLHVPVKGQKAQQIMKDKANAGAKVRIVVGDIPLTTDDTVDLVKGFFAGSPVNIRALYIGVSLLHSKAVIVDHTAFVIGPHFPKVISTIKTILSAMRPTGVLLCMT